jgi:tetrahydromethanopterin S-methyltransferase subunit B
MSEMLPLVQIVPEYNYALDPSTGIIGASFGKDLIILSTDEINEEISKVEIAADELINSLDPNTSPVNSFDGREGSYATAGLITNIAYGFVIGLLVLLAAIPLLTHLGVL